VIAPPRRRLLAAERSIAGTVYGTIVALSVLAAGAGSADIGPARLAGFVGTSAIVFWLAHVYAHGLAESIDADRILDIAELRSIARRESAIPLAALPPIAALLLGAIGVLRDSTAVWLAFGLGLATLGVQGFRYATIENLSVAKTIVIVALNVALGLLLVALKALLAH
jgi:hypothetical protein